MNEKKKKALHDIVRAGGNVPLHGGDITTRKQVEALAEDGILVPMRVKGKVVSYQVPAGVAGRVQEDIAQEDFDKALREAEEMELDDGYVDPDGVLDFAELDNGAFDGTNDEPFGVYPAEEGEAVVVDSRTAAEVLGEGAGDILADDAGGMDGDA